jgi:8-oxo-dGTP pyrophosphatase MutT (NUDIX family)
MIKRISSKIVYENKWMKVHEDEVRFPHNHNGIYGVVEKIDFALIMPFYSNTFYLVKQYRYAIQTYSWEFPQGKHENNPTIDPKILAKSELEEETGLKANYLEKIGYLKEAPGFSSQGFHIFFAKDFEQGTRQLEKTEEGLEVKRFSVNELEDMIRNGTIVDSPTVSAYGLLKLKGTISQ